VSAFECGGNMNREMKLVNNTMAAVGLAALLSLAACGQSTGERAVSGGLIGAGTGAAVGAVTGVGAGTGALVGGGVGAVGGAATSDNSRRYYGR